MTFLLIIWNNTNAQRLDTDFSLSAGGGSVSNTYLMPFVPEWDRSRISGFNSLTPAGQLRWSGSGRSASLYSAGHLLYFYDDRPAWIGGYASPVFRQHLVSGFSVSTSGGWSYYTSTYSRSMQWLFAGVEWVASPFVKFEVSAGSTWRTYLGLADWPEDTHRYNSYGLEFQYWPTYRWQLLTSFHSSLSHIQRPADGFAFFISAAHYRRSGLSIVFQTGLEQYSQEFQHETGNGGLPILSGAFTGMTAPGAMETMQNNEMIRLEDRFHRTSFHVSHPFSDRVTLTGSLSGLLWFSSEDNDIVPDYQISAGIKIPVSIPVSRSGEIRSMQWNTHSRQDQSRRRRPPEHLTPDDESHNRDLLSGTNQKLNATLTVTYRGNASLYITGDFNDWDDPGIPFYKAGRNRYRVEIDLSAGVYEYKIGKRTNDRHEWLELPDDVSTVNDGFGGQNGRLIIDY